MITWSYKSAGCCACKADLGLQAQQVDAKGCLTATIRLGCICITLPKQEKSALRPELVHQFHADEAGARRGVAGRG